MRIGKILFSHILIIALILFQVPPVALSDNINERKLIWEADEFRIVYTLNNLMLVSTHESDTKDNYDLIWLGNGKSLWGSRENPLRAYLETNDLYNESVVCFGRRIIISSIDNTCCYDLVAGKLLWMNPAISNLTKKMINVDGVVYSTFAKEYRSSKIEYVRFNLTDGKLVDVNEIEIDFVQWQFGNYTPVIMSVSKEYLFILFDYEIQCYSFSKKSVLWHHSTNILYRFDVEVVGNHLICFGTDFYKCEREAYVIYCIEISSGKEIWSVIGYPDYAIKGGFVYYSTGVCNNDTARSLFKLEIETGKVSKSFSLEKAKYSYNPLFYTGRYIIVEANFATDQYSPPKNHLLVFDHDLNLIYDMELDIISFNDTSIVYHADTFYIMSYRMSGTQKHKTGLFALPGYIPPNPNELLRLIFDGLRGNP